MSDRHSRHTDEKNVAPVIEQRTRSEAIRKGAAQVPGDYGSVRTADRSRKYEKAGVSRRDSTPPSDHCQIPTSSKGRHIKSDTKDKLLPNLPSSLSSTLKRKKLSGRSGFSDKLVNTDATASSSQTLASSSLRTSLRLYGPHQVESSSASSYRKVKNSPIGPSLQLNHADARYLDNQSRYVGANSEDMALAGPLAAAEFERVKRELASLKEELQDVKKASKRHTKKLEEAKSELSLALTSLKDKEANLSALKEKARTNEELLSTIEASIQCQICMELPENPFALSPCGHVLCLSCLKEWFRKAPPALDDMDVDPEELSDPHYILMRTKSCPSCRAVVKHRPVPIFMVKAVVSSLKRSKPTLSAHLSSRMDDITSDTDKENPWKGIFPSSGEVSAGETSDDDFEHNFAFESHSEDDEERELPDFRYNGLYIGYGDLEQAYADIISDSDNDDDSGNDDLAENGSSHNDDDDAVFQSSDEEYHYVLPRWTPPTVEVGFDTYVMSDMNPESVKLLQRGCSWEMLQNYNISYSHSFGIIVSLHSLHQLYASDHESDGDIQLYGMNRVFLGWNVKLDDSDHDGDAYMTDVLEDIKANPSRWQLTPRRGVNGAMDAKRLVPLDEAVEYDSTDTEKWLDAESEDL